MWKCLVGKKRKAYRFIRILIFDHESKKLSTHLKQTQIILLRRNCGYNSFMRGSAWLPPQPGQVLHQIRRHAMGEKGSKKDKNKADKQKKGQLEKKKEQQKTKLPAKKPA